MPKPGQHVRTSTIAFRYVFVATCLMYGRATVFDCTHFIQFVFFLSHVCVSVCVVLVHSMSFNRSNGTHAKPHLLSYDSIRFGSNHLPVGLAFLLVCHCLISRETNRVSKHTKFCPSISTIPPYALQLCLCKVTSLLDSLPPHYFPHNLTMISWNFAQICKFPTQTRTRKKNTHTHKMFIAMQIMLFFLLFHFVTGNEPAANEFLSLCVCVCVCMCRNDFFFMYGSVLFCSVAET